MEPEVIREIRKITVGCAIITVIVFLGFVVFGAVTLPAVLGCIVGFILSAGNFYFLSLGVTRALATGDENAAKRFMALSKWIRTVIQLGFVVFALATGLLHWIPVTASLFYPRIIIAVTSVYGTLAMRRDRRLHPEKYIENEYEPLPPDDDEDTPEEDGYEKFVGHFYHGEVPGEKKDSEKKG